MNGRKIIPLDSIQSAKDKLIEALGRVLERQGFSGLDAGAVAAEAGLNRRVLFRHFKGLPQLVRAFGASSAFWPSTQELVGEDAEALKAMPASQVVAAFFKRSLTALRKRPQTLKIMAWETLERNEYARCLDDARVRTALEFFEHIESEVPDSPDLSAVVALMAGAINYFLLRSRTSRFYGGFDFLDEADWRRFEDGIDALLKEALRHPR
jgi:AcrR family transcriptional regulator